MNKQDQFAQACEDGDIKTVKTLINHPDVDPSADGNYAIRFASKNGHEAILNTLIEYIIDLDHYTTINWEDIKIWCMTWGGLSLLNEVLENNIYIQIKEMKKESTESDLYF